MIRVLYFSDAHIEIRQGDESPAWSETLPLGFGPDLRPFVGTVDLLVLAGDIESTTGEPLNDPATGHPYPVLYMSA